MIYLKYAVLGLVQGLTEFLPVSSSGHLAIFNNLFGEDFTDLGLTYNILLHLATLIAVFFVYRKDIWDLIKSFFSLIRDVFKRQVDFNKNPGQKMVILLVLASIPAALVGVLLGDEIEGLPFIFVGIFLLITGLELFLSGRIKEGTLDVKDLKAKDSILPGIFQALALLPGISRSGSTITGALLSGFKRDLAVKFSFIMSIPVILGSALFDIIDIIKGEGVSPLWGPAIVGMIVAAISGYLSIKFMIKLIQDKKFHYFAYYCFGVGALVILWQLFI